MELKIFNLSLFYCLSLFPSGYLYVLDTRIALAQANQDIMNAPQGSEDSSSASRISDYLNRGGESPICAVDNQVMIFKNNQNLRLARYYIKVLNNLEDKTLMKKAINELFNHNAILTDGTINMDVLLRNTRLAFIAQDTNSGNSPSVESHLQIIYYLAQQIEIINGLCSITLGLYYDLEKQIFIIKS